MLLLLSEMDKEERKVTRVNKRTKGAVLSIAPFLCLNPPYSGDLKLSGIPIWSIAFFV